MCKTISFKDYSNSQLRPLCVRLLSLVALYSIYRFLFFIINVQHFSNATLSLFFHGIRFDLSAICYSNAPYIVAVLLPFSFVYKKTYQKIVDIYFIIINSLAAAVSYIDTAYYPYVLKRMTCDIFSYLQIGFDFQALLPSFLKQFWYLLLLFFATIIVIIYLVRFTTKMITKKPVFHPFFWKDFLYKISIFLVFIFFSVICARGGLQLRPIGLIDTGKDATIQNAPLVSNTPFTLITSVSELQNKVRKNYFKNLDEAETIFSPIISTIAPCTQYCYPVKNVVVIVLESFSQYLINGMTLNSNENDCQGYCPFIDSLQQNALSFNGIASGHRTIDALTSIFGGIPKLLNKSYVESSFANNYSFSPIEILKKHDYHTLFFHGAKNGSMNIESYCYSIGFDAYYGLNEYPNPSDYDGFWGISDRSYLKHVSTVLAAAPQPFFAGILTLSSHNPFVVPKDAEGLDIKKGTHNMHAVASYTDYAIKEFFEEMSHYTWYDHTLFVITGDHIGAGSLPLINSFYMTCQVPIFFYHPLAKNNKTMGAMSQLDIMPSLFSYLKIDEPLFSYGNNVFDTTYNMYSINYLWDIYHLITDDYILQFDGEKSIGFFDIQNDILMQNNLLKDSTKVVAFYEQKLKAILQSYTTRLATNQLFINEK